MITIRTWSIKQYRIFYDTATESMPKIFASNLRYES